MKSADSVKFRDRRYSPDERRYDKHLWYLNVFKQCAPDIFCSGFFNAANCSSTFSMLKIGKEEKMIVLAGLTELVSSLKENLSFVIVSLTLTLLMVAIAKVAETMMKLRKDPRLRTRKITCIAIFSAIAGVLMVFDFALPFIPSFYKLDLSSIPVMIVAFAYGPVAGIVSEFIKVVLKVLFKGTSTAFVGELAEFLIGSFLIMPASIIYHLKKTKKTAIIGLATGTFAMTVFGSIFNAIYLIPAYARLFGMPLEAIIGMASKANSEITNVSTLVIWAVVPFNILKGVVVSVVTMLIYKKLSPVIHSVNENRKNYLPPENEEAQS